LEKKMKMRLVKKTKYQVVHRETYLGVLVHTYHNIDSSCRASYGAFSAPELARISTISIAVIQVPIHIYMRDSRTPRIIYLSPPPQEQRSYMHMHTHRPSPSRAIS